MNGTLTMYRILLSLLTALLGLALLVGGIWLAAIGGSWFFMLLGALVLASAWILFNRRPEG